MWSDIITLFFSVLGMVFILMVFVLRLTVWQSEKITIAIPLYYNDESIYSKVYRIHSLIDFIGMNKKCTIVVINYGASEIFCNYIRDYYKNYSFLKVLNSCDIQDKLF